MGHKKWHVFGLYCILALAGLAYTQQAGTPATSAPTQPSAQPQNAGTDNPSLATQTATVLKVTTRLVVVDVVATDRKGEPVTDLKAEDFTVLEGGAEQAIRAFSFQHPSAPAGVPAALLPSPTLPPNTFSNAPRYKSEGAATVLLIDGLNTKLSNQTYAREQLLKYLEKLPDNQRVAVFLLSSKLQMLQDFTNDSKVIKNVVKHLKDNASPVITGSAGGDTSSNLGLPSGIALEILPAQMLQAMQQFERETSAYQTDLRVRMTLDALNALARSLAGYPGRKNLVWLSESFPLSIVPDAQALKQSSSARLTTTTRDYSMEVARTASYLTDAQIAVYPVDVRGLVNNDVYSSLSNTSSTGEYMGRTATGRSGNRGNGTAPGLGDELGRTSDELIGTHSAMGEIADSTGGKAYYNRNDVDHAIQKSLDDGSTYYTLAYYPQNKDWDGRFRKITLKTSHSGVKLRYRQGYYAIDPLAYAKQDPNAKAADFGRTLSLDYPLVTALRFDAEVIPPSEKTKNKTYINYKIDPHALSFELKGDGLQYSSVDCAVQVFSSRGAPVLTHGNTMSYQMKPEIYQQVMAHYFPCQQVIDLGPGDYILRLGVRDGHTGLIGTLNAKITVPPTTAPSSDNKPEEKKP